MTDEQRRNMEAWVAALRSGEYKQAKHRLRSRDGHCCLGVACDVHAKATGGAWDGGSYQGENMVMPPDVAVWLGIIEQQGYFSDAIDPIVTAQDGQEHSLAHVNDSLMYNFGQIAQAIEDTWLKPPLPEAA